jgi:protein MpaA
VLVAAPPPAPAAPPSLHAEVIGHAVSGRPIRLVRVGDPAARRRVLVVGCVHGDERAGLAITRALRASTPPAGTQLLLLDRANPDGCAARTRGNARRVDLNRNFPWGWRRLRGIYDSGPRPSSEPETRAVEQLLIRERPDVALWYHQHLDWVDLQRGSSVTLMRRYARVAGMPAVRTPTLPGTAPRWANHRAPGHSAFVVELAAGAPTPGVVAAHVRAVRAVARMLTQRTAAGARVSAGSRQD